MRLASSLPLLDELQRVLKYPKLGFSAEEAGVFLQDILAHASLRHYEGVEILKARELLRRLGIEM